MPKKKWKKFEDKSHEVVSGLHPSSQVYKNVHIEGKLSKVLRQVDVQLIDPKHYDYIAFECKDYSRPLDVPIIEAFHTKLMDIGASKGAIVSNSAFSQAAQNMADKLGIDLLNLVDTSDGDIRTKVYATLLLSDTSLKSFQLRISSTAQEFLLPLEAHQITFSDDKGDKGTAYEIFASLWNDQDSGLSHTPGIYSYQPPHPEKKRIIDLRGREVKPDKIEFIYEVVEKHYAGKIRLTETQGLFNVKENSFQTRSMQTEPIVAYEIEQKWPEISAQEAQERRNAGEFTMMLSCSSVMPDKYEKVGKEKLADDDIKS
jgi:hypothetical protein